MARPKNVRCALFDFDGVVVNSEPVAARRNMGVMARLGAPATYEECLAMAGCSGEREVPELLAKYGSTCTFEDFLALHNDPATDVIYLEPALEVYEGLRELLARLRAQGVRLGLVSTTRSAQVLQGLNRFGLVSAFDIIVTGDMVSNRKPHPEPYLRGMELLRAEPAHTVIFEDSPAGLAAARASGAYVFGVRCSEVPQRIEAADEFVDSYVGFDPLAPAGEGASEQGTGAAGGAVTATAASGDAAASATAEVGA